MLDQLKARARALKQEVYAIYIAARDPRTPWYVKALVFFVVAHTFSPIDLIPDFIPILGYLDDLVITPGGLWQRPGQRQLHATWIEAWVRSGQCSSSWYGSLL
jgi:uncharacterized membrane protein YkvA (DUF1232 family)